jgi:hypothetical protein
VAIICIRHFKKSTDDINLMNRGGGSIGIIGAMRHGLVILADPEQEGVRYFGVTKHNLAPEGTPVLSYSLIGIDTEIAGEKRSMSSVCWLGSTVQSLDQLNREQAELPSARNERNNREAMKLCFESLEVLLRDGEWHRSTDVRAQMDQAGHSKRTYERCSEEWSDNGRLERRKKGNTKDADGNIVPGVWEMRLLPGASIEEADGV